MYLKIICRDADFVKKLLTAYSNWAKLNQIGCSVIENYIWVDSDKLMSENGIHSWCRKVNGLRRTSFAEVLVGVLDEENITISVNSTVGGGQHGRPTIAVTVAYNGVLETSNSERSMARNLLRSKMVLADYQGSHNHIRKLVFHPHLKMVNYVNGYQGKNPQNFFDGTEVV